MKRFISLFFVAVICAAFAGCQTIAGQPSPGSAPSAPQDVESIVEPVAGTVDEKSSAPVSAAQSESESEASEVSAPSSEGNSESARSAASSLPPEESPSDGNDAAVVQDEQIPRSDIPSEQELLPTVAPEKKLESEIIERELLRLINNEREGAGLESLGFEEHMLFAARIRAEEALSSFSHTRPDGTPYNTAFDEAGFSYAGKWHGENLASLHVAAGIFDEKNIAVELFDGLMSSPGHRGNMLNENFLQAGIGVVVRQADGSIDIASSQLFASL